MGHFDNYPFVLEPYGYQREVLEDTCERKAWALFMEMGTGKSKILIDNFCWLYLNGKIDTVVIAAKKGMYANWLYDQLPEHMPPEVPYEAYLFSTVYYRTSDGRRAFASLKRPDKSRLRILIINVECLHINDAKIAMGNIFASSSAVFFLVDESTCVKHYDSKRSKETYFWSSKAEYRRIATGSPITQSPMDLWGEVMVLGKGLLGHGSFFSFRGKFAQLETKVLTMPGNVKRTYKVITGFKHMDELSQIMKSFSTVLTKDECLDLPPKTYVKQFVELHPEQERVYKELRDFAMTELASGRQIEAAETLSLLVKLHQVSCGQLRVGDNEYETIPNNRIETMMELIEDYPGKVIVWAGYRQTLLDIHRALVEVYGDRAVADYHGLTPDKERSESVKRFQDPNDDLRFLVANPASGGYGLTLTATNLAIYYSNTYNLEHRLQSEDRIHRIGQKHPVTYIDLISRGTVDEKIIKALKEKKNIADEVIKGGIEPWL